MDDEDEPTVGYMFDSCAPTAFERFSCARGAATVEVEYACQAVDCATTADQSGHSAWPAAKQLARHVAGHVDVRGKSVLELGCGIGLVGLVCLEVGAVRVSFTDRDPGVLRLVASAVERRGADPSRFSTRRVIWSESPPPDDAVADDEQYDIVLAADVIYDPGVVAPLVATASRRLKRSGVFWLAASFELGDSTILLEEAARRRGLRLELASRDGSATLWRLATRRTVPEIVEAEATSFELRPRCFLNCWAGTVALAFQGWPRKAVRLKDALEAEVADALPPENLGSRWPKITLGSRRRADRRLSRAEYDKLDKALAKCAVLITTSMLSWRVASLTVTHFATPSHERLLSAQSLALRQPSAVVIGDEDTTSADPASVAYVDAVVAETRIVDTYVDAFNRPGSAARYTDVHPGAALVAFLRRDGGPHLLGPIHRARRDIEAALPGFFEWFDDDALHVTLRSLQ